jgi:regulator of protease activity HflC (stomatin/prohibitin superfamily)
MTTYGYTIINTLVTDIDPDIQVKNAMNINAADREKTVAEFEAEASRIRIVESKAAESKRLQGQGIADQRREIARGLVEC